MNKYLVSLLILFLMLLFPELALADDTTTAAPEVLDPMTDYLTGFSSMCGQEILPTGAPGASQELKFISTIVHCFENIISTLAVTTITQLANNLRTAVNAAMVAYVVIFGVRVVTGQVTNPRQEVFVNAIKLVFVAWLINNMGIMQMWYMTIGTYQSVLAIMITPAALQSCPSSLISLDMIWGTMDCLFGKLIGYNAQNGYGQSWQGVALLFSMLTAQASQGGPAYLVGAFIANAMLTILFSFLQICMAYIISMLGLLLLFSIAPLALPCMFFRPTYNYFEAWYKMIISFILQVTILFAFCSFAFAIIDQIYSGPNGLQATFAGTKVSNEVTRTDTLGTNTIYWQKFQTMFTDALSGNGDMNMIVSFVSLLVLGYLMVSFIGIIGQMAQELAGSTAFPNLMSTGGNGGMNLSIPKL